MSYEILITDKCERNGERVKLYFSRYFDNNPALILKNSDEIPVLTCTVDLPDFYNEYPFGDYKLVAVKDFGENQGILEILTENAVLEQVFSYQGIYSEEKIMICELSEPVVDLLKSFGEYYV